MSGFEANPFSGGMPEIARHEMANVAYVIGIFFLSPPMSGISWLCTAWITEPAPRNSRPLNPCRTQIN